MKKNRLRAFWMREAYKAWVAAGSPSYGEKVRIFFHIRRGRKLDPDNALAGLKSLIDGLTTRRIRALGLAMKGLIQDDSDVWVVFDPIEFETGAKWKGEKAEVWIEVLPERIYREIRSPEGEG